MPTFTNINFTLIDDADTETNFSPSQTVSVDTEFYVQRSTPAGTEGSIAYQASKNSVTDITLSPAAAVDLSSSLLHFAFRCDVMALAEPATSGNTGTPPISSLRDSGFMIGLQDGTNNVTPEYHIAGATEDGTNPPVEGTRGDYKGEWAYFSVEPIIFTNGVTSNVIGTQANYDNSLISLIRFSLDHSNSGNFRAVDNSFIDAVYAHGGIQGVSTTTENFNFNDYQVYSQDETRKYGVILLTDGALIAQNKLFIGGTGSENSNFNSSNEVLIFREGIANGFYTVTAQEGTGTTNITIDGLFCKSNGILSAASFDLTDVVTGTVVVTNSSLIDMSTVSFNTGTIDGCIFNGCDSVVAGTASYSNTSFIDLANGISKTNFSSGTFSNCTIDNTNLVLNSTGTDMLAAVTNCTTASDGFITLEGTAATSVQQTSNNTYEHTGTVGNDVGITTGNFSIDVPATTGTVTIKVTGGNVPAVRTGGATINVVQTSTLVISDIKDGTEIRIIRDSDTTEIGGVESVSGGVGTTINNGTGTVTISGSTDANVFTFEYPVTNNTVTIRLISLEYKLERFSRTLGSTALSIVAQQRTDPNYSDPPP